MEYGARRWMCTTATPLRDGATQLESAPGNVQCRNQCTGTTMCVTVLHCKVLTCAVQPGMILAAYSAQNQYRGHDVRNWKHDAKYEYAQHNQT